MRAARRTLAFGLLALASLHCGSDDPSAPATPSSDAGASDERSVVPAPVDASVSPYGLDTRPANPTCRVPKRPRPADAGVTAEMPIALVKRPGVPRWYVVQQKGKIFSFEDTPAVAAATVTIDLTSRVYARTEESDVWRMSPLASQRVDTEGTALLRAWFTGQKACP